MNANEQGQATATEPDEQSCEKTFTPTQPTPGSEEDLAWLEAYSDRATAWSERMERTYPGPLLRGIQRACAPFAGKQERVVYIYPDGNAFCRGDFSAIWIHCLALQGLDLRLPLATKLGGSEVEAVATPNGFDLHSTRNPAQCSKATVAKPIIPSMPEAAFAMLYHPWQMKDCLPGKGNARITIVRDQSDPWQVWIDGNRAVLDRGATPSTAHFEGRAQRDLLLALLTSGTDQQWEVLEVAQRNGACGLMTSVGQSIGGTRATVTRFVALGAVRPGGNRGPIQP